MAVYYEIIKDEDNVTTEIHLYRRRVKVTERVLLLGSICNIYLRKSSVYGAVYSVFAGDIYVQDVDLFEVHKNIGGHEIRMYKPNNYANEACTLKLPKKIAKKTLTELRTIFEDLKTEQEILKIKDVMKNKQRSEDSD